MAQLGRYKEEAAERAAAHLDAGEAIGLVADVTDRDAIGGAVDALVERVGGLDVVIANIGVNTLPVTPRAMDHEAFEACPRRQPPRGLSDRAHDAR